MIKLEGNEIWRGGEKIGWVEENWVRAHDDRKLGYFEGDHIYDWEGKKIAYLEGDHLCSEGSSIGSEGGKIPLEKVSESIVGGVLPEIAKCAIYVLLGA